MNELQILDAVSRHGGSIPYTRLMSVGMSCPDWSPAADKQLILYLIRADVLSGRPGAYQTIRFGPRGELRLQHLQQIAREQAKCERQQRFENKIAVANILVPLATFVIGILVEYRTGIIELIKHFFEH